jgi:hypothetical protein
MYRVPPSPPEAPPPADYVYAVADHERVRALGVAVFQALLCLPFLAGMLFLLLPSPFGALATLGGGVLLVRWWWRRRSSRGGAVLHVEGDELHVVSRKTGKLDARVRFADLRDVTLDTRTVHPMMEGSSPIPGLRVLEAKALPTVDEKRIVLVCTSGSVPLTEAHLPSVEVIDEFGKMRVFLRKHGWVPESERERADRPAAS